MPKHDDANTADGLRTLAIWAEIIASIAVVVSLIFVGLQIRQSAAETALNTRAAEASSYQNLQAQLGVATSLQIENPDLRRVIARLSGGDQLDGPGDEDDLHIYLSFCRLLIRLADLAYSQYEAGLITEERLVSILAPLRIEVLGNALGLSIWNEMSPNLVVEFVRYIDSTQVPGSPGGG